MAKNKKTHYEVLNLKEDCSSKEIRTAFVKLSKECHPDSDPKNKSLHDKFVDVNEAYSVLNKPEQRRNYDLTLSFNRSRSSRINGSTSADGMHEANGTRYKKWRDESIWEMRDKSKDKPPDPNSYYGFKGIRRVGNGWIFGGALMFMLVGTVFHYFTIKTGTSIAVQKLNDRDRTLGMKLYIARQAAIANGNDRQIELLEERWAEAEAEAKRAAGR